MIATLSPATQFVERPGCSVRSTTRQNPHSIDATIFRSVHTVFPGDATVFYPLIENCVNVRLCGKVPEHCR
jgi:hypothetical protein